MGKILVLDVSERATGWAVVDAAPRPEFILAHGCIVTKPEQRRVSKTDDDIRRVSLIAGDIQQLVEGYLPLLIVAELPTGSQSAAGATARGIVLGVLGSVRVLLDVPCVWITPQSVKKAAASIKNASKEEVQAGILRVWDDLEFPNKVEREAVCDALGALLAARDTDLYMMARVAASEGGSEE